MLWNKFVASQTLALTVGLAVSLTSGLTGGCVAQQPAGENPAFCVGAGLDQVVPGPQMLDVLFVIDNSHAMAPEQAELLANFAYFAEVFEDAPDGSPDLHIAAISTDVGLGTQLGGSACRMRGDDGRLHARPSHPDCLQLDGSFLRDSPRPDGTRERNFAGPLSQAFACIGDLGTDGCGFEQPLEAMRRAFDGSQPDNAGFRRPGAHLLIVIVTNEDDCSALSPELFDADQSSPEDPLGPLSSFRCFDFGVRCDPDTPREPGQKSDCRARTDSPYVADVAGYVEFLHGLDEDPSRIMVAALAGAPGNVEVALVEDGLGALVPALNPACAPSTGAADPAVRLAAFVDEFGSRGHFASICDGDWRTPLGAIAEAALAQVRGTCLYGALTDSDADADNGIQPECGVYEVTPPGGAGSNESELLHPWPICDRPLAPQNPPCYVIEADERCADTPAGLSVRAVRGDYQPPAGVEVRVRCVTDDTPPECPVVP